MSVADRLTGLLHLGEPAYRNMAAAALQRSLMPDVLPAIAGLNLAARYVPAEGDLGGDWYDVFRLPDGSVGFVMGDVMGHGFASAVIMGRLRSSLRSYALDHADPAEVLHRLDRKIKYFEPGAMATVIYGVSAPPFDTVRLSSAGHLPPIIAGPDGCGTLALVTPDLPLGVDIEPARHSTDVALAAGATFCLYTDGLVERRDGSPDTPQAIDEQIASLCAVVTADEPGAVVARIIESLAGPDGPDDDLAVIVVRRTD